MDSLNFSYDPVADSLDVGGVTYKGGAFRSITGPIGTTSGSLVVESRGGGVFHVSVPHHVARKPVAPTVVASVPAASKATAPVASNPALGSK